MDFDNDLKTTTEIEVKHISLDDCRIVSTISDKKLARHLVETMLTIEATNHHWRQINNEQTRASIRARRDYHIEQLKREGYIE